MPKRSKKRSDFLEDDCGQNALQLAARGSAIIAELLRLSENIPEEFRYPEKFPQYSKIMCNFDYFEDQDAFERGVQESAALLDEDEAFRASHIDLLERFFKLFRGVYGYVQELNRFVEEIGEGLYLSQTLEGILISEDGKQLLCELYYLYGVMLLLLDYRIGGRTREHLIVSYIRYRGSGEQHTVAIVEMCRSTGYQYDRPLPKQYPVRYFARVKVDTRVVEMLIARLTSDDIYQMSYNYPAPNHRSTALSQQGGMLYVLLFFCPEYLRNRKQDMQEIVNKHFTDNWVISYYMGFTVDLTVAWEHFPAASSVIAPVVSLDNVSYYQRIHKENVARLNKDIAAYLREGVLTEMFVLDNIYSKLLPCIRDANVTLRWFVLHMTRGGEGRRYFDSFKASYERVNHDIDMGEILTLLLRTAQLEFDLRSMFERFLKEKRTKWGAARDQAVRKMTKLATFFSGEDVLSEAVKVTRLMEWFQDIAARIESLDYGDSTTANRKMQKLMQALEQVLEFHQIDSNLQVVQFIHDTRALLRQMIRYINIETKVLITIAIVGDLSYAWELMSTYRCFVEPIQRKVQRSPHLAIQLRSTFVKLSTMLDLPLTRIDQAAGNDALLTASLESVTEYYSSKLVAFIRGVLHIIPTSIFKVLREIVTILVSELKECPTKVPRKDMKVQSQLEVRQRLSRLTADIANYANGILAMETTRIGIMDVNPHRLLEDGIRKELTAQITSELHTRIVLEPGKVLTAKELDEMLQGVAKQLHGMRHAFEYVQDYINVHGLRIWIEELARIVYFNVDMECNAFMSKKVYNWDSKYQSEAIPIPYYPPANGQQIYSFLGQLVKHLLNMTDPRRAQYIAPLGGWYDLGTLREVVGPRTFTAIAEAIGPTGVYALDRLLCFLAAKDLQLLVGEIRGRGGEAVEAALLRMKQELSPETGMTEGGAALYSALHQALGAAFVADCGEVLTRVGRIQLLRQLAANELRSEAKLNSGNMFLALTNANHALLDDLTRHYEHPNENRMPGSIIGALTSYLDAMGISDATSKVYITTKPFPELCFILLDVIVWPALEGRILYDERVKSLMPAKPGERLDMAACSMGVLTTMKQFHSEMRRHFFGHFSQFMRILMASFDIESAAAAGAKDILPQPLLLLARVLHGLVAMGVTDAEKLDLERETPPQLMAAIYQAPAASPVVGTALKKK